MSVDLLFAPSSFSTGVITNRTKDGLGTERRLPSLNYRLHSCTSASSTGVIPKIAYLTKATVSRTKDGVAPITFLSRVRPNYHENLG